MSALKHPKLYKCGICGERYAVLNSTWHISASYRMKFCGDCTIILEATIRKLKKALRVQKYATDES